jgi:hypothetical protein
MTRRDERLDPRGRHAHAIFVILDFLRYADEHGSVGRKSAVTARLDFNRGDRVTGAGSLGVAGQRLPAAVDQTLHGLVLDLVRHLAALRDPVAEVEMLQTELAAPVDLP